MSDTVPVKTDAGSGSEQDPGVESGSEKLRRSGRQTSSVYASGNQRDFQFIAFHKFLLQDLLQEVL